MPKVVAWTPGIVLIVRPGLQHPPYFPLKIIPSRERLVKGTRTFYTSCIACEPKKCTLGIRLTFRSAREVCVDTHGSHQQHNPCQRRVRTGRGSWTAPERRALRQVGPHEAPDAVVRVLDDAGLPAVGAEARVQRCQRHAARRRQEERGEETAQCLREWAESMRYANIPQGDLQRHTFFVLRHRIDPSDVQDAKFYLAFTCPGLISLLSKFVGPIALSMDGPSRSSGAATWS